MAWKMAATDAVIYALPQDMGTWTRYKMWHTVLVTTIKELRTNKNISDNN